MLVDSYGSPTAASDLKFFHDTYYPNLPAPNFSTVFPNGAPDYNNDAKGNGQSGPIAAANWSGEATLDIEWSYAIAPLAHIVLLAVPPAETEGVQGFPTLFNAISNAIDTNPAGTVFSMSFGVTEQTFGGAAQQQTAKFDAVFQKGNAKGDTFFASSGDNGSFGVAKQHRDTAGYSNPTDGWPASSPYVTSVGGTQLQSGWTWNPTCDIPFDPTDGREQRLLLQLHDRRLHRGRVERVVGAGCDRRRPERDLSRVRRGSRASQVGSRATPAASPTCRGTQR